jgi:regulator of protease activity HflC (stomatin/prohibitin superfamily)
MLKFDVPLKEVVVVPRAGGPMLFVGLSGMLAGLATFIGGVYMVNETRNEGLGGLLIVAGILGGLSFFIFNFGLIVNQPNEAKVLTFFGRYIGTVKKDGWFWVNPFNSKVKISLRINNFETERLKVNDLDGNPIEIGAIVVWRVVETAEASFAVEDYHDYVRVQSEAALRNLATHYTYDGHDEHTVSLRSHTAVVAEKLAKEIQDRLAQAGVEVIEARISHLAYAPEIAQAMLQRQQAGAIIAARQMIVEGAVGMVEMALAMLSAKKVVELEQEQRAAMVSNLLVVLCSDRSTQPIVNTGSIHP